VKCRLSPWPAGGDRDGPVFSMGMVRRQRPLTARPPFPAGFEPGDASPPVWVAAAKLASRLGAVIRGDE
jgi:hypothetical protein